MSSSTPLSPLETVLVEVPRAIRAKLYYPALLLALTIPDICVALTRSKNEYVKREDYEDFLKNYSVPQLLGMDPDTCYQLRGGLVHRGNLSGHSHFDKDGVIFTVPETGTQIHGPTLIVGEQSVMVFALELFCLEMDRAARRWLGANKDNPQVQNNLPNLIRLYPNGALPFTEGSPVLASGISEYA